MKRKEIDRIECAIRHIKTAVDVDPWAVEIAVEAMKTQLSVEGTTSDLISRQAAINTVKKHYRVDNDLLEVIVYQLENLPSAQPDVPDTNVGDIINRQAAIDVLCTENCNEEGRWCDDGDCSAVRRLKALPSAQPEWNNHTVACLLAELFDDTCACNYNGIDEWLPRKCELLDSCPNPVGVACWEQYLKHRAERRTDE